MKMIVHWLMSIAKQALMYDCTETKTGIPTLAKPVKKTPSKRNWSKSHHGAFDNMESIDDYLERKRRRIDALSASKKPKVTRSWNINQFDFRTNITRVKMIIWLNLSMYELNTIVPCFIFFGAYLVCIMNYHTQFFVQMFDFEDFLKIKKNML